MEATASSFSNVLRRLRLAAALSQEELAARAGLSARGVSDLERGVRHGPRPETLRMLADALALSGNDREMLFTAAQLERREMTKHQDRTTLPRWPQPVGPLFGRDEERAALAALLERTDVQLVTLTGMGGTGKTHLALDVAGGLRDQFRDGVFFVDLTPITDPVHVMPAVARALRVDEAPGRPILETLIASLREKQLLILLDNCEQVLAAAPEVGALLASCPGLTVLATSREALSLRGEREWSLAPLPLPDLELLPPLADLQRSPPVALFVARAEASTPQFSLTLENAKAVAAICHRVDGLPLGIELAAAHVKLLSPEELASRLDRRLPLLTRGARDAPSRQRTLRHAIAWSYDLLTPEEQALFRRLGVFVGGWTVEAAEALMEPTEGLDIIDGLASLLDKSLVRINERGETSRYGMLETVREFALEQLEHEGERAVTRERHAAYFLQLGERGAAAMEGIGQRRWLALLEREHPNLREAFATLEASGDDTGYLRLATSLFLFWFFHTHAAEGLPRLRRVLALETGPTVERARALMAAGCLAYGVGAYADAERWLQEGEDLARALGERWVLGNTMLLRGAVAEHLGDEAAAEYFFQSALGVAQEIGNTWLIGEVLPNLSDAAYRRGDLDLAERFALDGFAPLAESENAYMESMNFANVAQVVLARGDTRRAAAAFGDALRVAEEIESRWNVANAIAGAAAVEVVCGRHDRAARLLGAADAAREASGHPRFPQFHLVSQTEEALRNVLGPDRFRAGWDAGRALPIDGAVDEARVALDEAADVGDQPRAPAGLES
jgi:predicted ATPase/DNA-binding XRE family transcriptional regulator